MNASILGRWVSDASIIEGDVRLELPAVTRSMIVAIVTTKLRLFVQSVTRSSQSVASAQTVVSIWENIFVMSANSTTMILIRGSSIAMTVVSAELVVVRTSSTAKSVDLAIL